MAFFAPKKWHQLTGDIRSPSDLTEISGVMPDIYGFNQR